MTSFISIVLMGLPEYVQRIADAVDVALLGPVDWGHFAALCGDEVIVQGRGPTWDYCVERRTGIQPLQSVEQRRGKVHPAV